MTVRADLIAQLRDELPDTIQVLDAPKVPDNIPVGVVALLVVERSRIEPGPSIGTYDEELHLHVLSPSTDPDTIDDGLDDALDVVLEALHPVDWARFVSAARSTFSDVYHSYDITTNATTRVTSDTPAT